MKPQNITGYRYAALLSLPAFLLLNSFTVQADPTVIERSTLLTSRVEFHQDKIREAIYDWHQHPESYRPDGLGDYDDNFILRVVSVDRLNGSNRTKPSDAQ